MTLRSSRRLLHRLASAVAGLLGLAALGGLLGCATGGAPGSSAPVAPRPPLEAASTLRPGIPSADEPLPLDPAVRAGRLENGLRYFVRGNSRPAARAALWLAGDAGSVQEDEDQAGLAHFLEHMAFNGTDQFPKRELVAWLEGTGMRFGPDVNAWTSFDETVYMLLVPTDDPAMLGRGLEVLEQWACCLTLDPAEVEAERGVVIEEWRLGRGAAARVRDRQLPILWSGSLYAERLPIGRPEVLAAATPELLRRYQRDWYRPDLMAVIAVGDFDPAAVEAEIEARFSGLAAPAAPRARTSPEVPLLDEAVADVVTDAELPMAGLSISRRGAREPRGRVADFRRDLVRSLWTGLVNARLDERRRAAEAPFLFAAAGTGGLRGGRLFRFHTAAAPDRLTEAFRSLAAEAERARRFGFSAEELERRKAEVLRGYESALADRDKTESETLARELLGHVLEGYAVPGIERELELVSTLLPGITLAEVQAAGEHWFEGPAVVLANLPAREDIPAPTPESLLAELTAAAALELEPYEDRTIAGPLVPEPPEPGRVVEERAVPELELVDWTLSNGVRVLLRPSDFKNDEVLLRGFRPGGHSNATEEEYASARFASSILAEGGAGRFDAVALRKALAGKRAGAGARIDELEEEVSGRASPRDLETMFELAYLSVTAPRADAAAFESFRTRLRGMLENRLAQPQAQFEDEFNLRFSQHHPRRQPPTPASLDALDLAVAERFHRSRFARPDGFTFVLVGAFEIEVIRPLVERWLGGLPGGGDAAAAPGWRDLGIEAPAGVQSFELRRGVEPKAALRLVFHGPASFGREEQHALRSLADALRIELREVLREEEGGTYGVSVSGGLTDRPRPRFSLAIEFGCDPERAVELEASLFAALERIRAEGPGEETVAKVRETQRREREVALRQNGFWAGSLEGYLRNGWDPRLILAHDELIAASTPEALAAAARRYADPAQYLLGKLLPQAVPATP